MRSLAVLALLGVSVLAGLVEVDGSAQAPDVAERVRRAPPLPEGFVLEDPVLERERQRQIAAGERTGDGRGRDLLETLPSTPPSAAQLPPLAPSPPKPKPPPSREEIYFDALNTRIHDCMDRGDYDPSVLCYPKLSPPKCEDAALAMIASPSHDQRAWYFCVRSCATASLWSRTFGECAAP